MTQHIFYTIRDKKTGYYIFQTVNHGSAFYTLHPLITNFPYGTTSEVVAGKLMDKITLKASHHDLEIVQFTVEMP